jgi:phosphatidylethanolamine-binding protein
MATTISDATANLAAVGLIPLLADSVGGGVDLRVAYGGRPVTRGETLSADEAADPPSITIRGAAGAAGSYTLLCVDPHAPSPAHPTLACWLHALIVNAPGPDIDRGSVVVPYAGPSPPRGKHAYVWLAYRQPAGPLTGVRPPKARSHFQTKAWAKDHGLGAVPAAATFFWVSAEEE